MGFSSRCLSGFALSLNTIASFSIINSEFPNNLERAISYVELVAALGYSFGPLLLTLIYAAFGVENAFIIYGTLVAVSAGPLFFVQIKESTFAEQKPKVSGLHLLRHAVRAIQPIIANILALAMYAVVAQGFGTLLALHISALSYDTSTTAVIYFIYASTYLVFALIPSYIPKVVPRYFIVCSGLLAAFVAFGLIGPYPFIPTSIWLITLGSPLLGLGYAFVYSRF